MGCLSRCSRCSRCKPARIRLILIMIYRLSLSARVRGSDASELSFLFFEKCELSHVSPGCAPMTIWCRSRCSWGCSSVSFHASQWGCIEGSADCYSFYFTFYFVQITPYKALCTNVYVFTVSLFFSLQNTEYAEKIILLQLWPSHEKWSFFERWPHLQTDDHVTLSNSPSFLGSLVPSALVRRRAYKV